MKSEEAEEDQEEKYFGDDENTHMMGFSKPAQYGSNQQQDNDSEDQDAGDEIEMEG
jgi:hypothetical protein